VAMRIFLIANNIDIEASQEEKYRFVIDIAPGNNKHEEIVDWLKNHIIL
jgi:prophage maintenance system killer protein